MTPHPSLPPLMCHSFVGALDRVGARNRLTSREEYLHDSGSQSLFLIRTLQKFSSVWSLVYSDYDTWAEHPLKDRLSLLNPRTLSFRTSPATISNKMFPTVSGTCGCFQILSGTQTHFFSVFFLTVKIPAVTSITMLAFSLLFSLSLSSLFYRSHMNLVYFGLSELSLADFLILECEVDG